MSSNPNNCATCKHMINNNDEELHCYMFKDEPTEICMQHSWRSSMMSPLRVSSTAKQILKFSDV